MKSATVAQAALDVIHPSGERTRILIHPLPFRIGRGPDNHLILRDNRASRAHAWILKNEGAFVIEDLESLHGTWVNGKRIEAPTPLTTGDAVHFGFEESYRLLFSESEDRVHRMLDRLSASSAATEAAGGFARLRALVEVARVLQTSLSGDEVLSAVVDVALGLTTAERGFLLLRSGETLEMKVARDIRGRSLTKTDLHIPSSLIQQALQSRHDLLSMSFTPEAFEDGAGAESEFRNVICVPLVQFRSINTEETLSLSSQTNTIGLLYLDSREKQIALSELNRELLHTLALEASTVLENAKLLDEERQKRLIEQEIGFARNVQQSLLPRKFPDSGWFRAAGSSLPSAEVAGDYFDVHPMGADDWAAIVADVSGKGVSSALLASLLQGAFLLGSELASPVDSVMAKINDFLVDRAQGEKYATVFYATICRSGALAWANAGHCEPFLVRASGEILKLATTGMPIGLRRDAEVGVERLQLISGDKVIAYSDGLTEAENAAHETFDSKLQTVLADSIELSADETHRKIIDEVLQFRQGEPLRDDVTVLVLEYCNPPTPETDRPREPSVPA